MALHLNPNEKATPWQPSGRKRVRAGWFGRCIAEYEEERLLRYGDFSFRSGDYSGMPVSKESRWRRYGRGAEVCAWGAPKLTTRPRITGWMEVTGQLVKRKI